MKNIFLRMLSATLAILVLAFTWLFLSPWGMVVLTSFVTVVLAWEYTGLILKNIPYSHRVIFVFIFLLPIIFVGANMASPSNFTVQPSTLKVFNYVKVSNTSFGFLSFLFWSSLFIPGLLWIYYFFIKKVEALWALKPWFKKIIQYFLKPFNLLSLGFISFIFISWSLTLFLVDVLSLLPFFLTDETGVTIGGMGGVLSALTLSLIFVGDSFAYLGGKLLGGKKLAPSISPGKTWSGLTCGLFMTGLLAFAFHFLFLETYFLSKQFFIPGIKYYNLFYQGVLSFCVGVLIFFVAQTGDLFVSFLKRVVGVKDTGSWFPGHGGFLDRLDGVLMALPFTFALYYIFAPA